MIKIFISVRNRLEITKKCVEALERHSTIPHDIYIFNNCTNYKIREHFEYFYNLYINKLIVQCTFNTTNSTFNAFSKAVSSNQFGQLHMMDPNWKNYDFLMILDNDIIVFPNWDKILKNAWDDIKKFELDKQIKVIGQLPGGIKAKKLLDKKIAGYDAKIGRLGGSGFWSIQPNFFHDIGFLDINKFIKCEKRHDQEYWNKLENKSKGKDYILGLDTTLCYHCSKLTGSVCNSLTRYKNDKNKLDKIKFEDAEKKIGNMSFDEFFGYIKNNPEFSEW